MRSRRSRIAVKGTKGRKQTERQPPCNGLNFCGVRCSGTDTTSKSRSGIKQPNRCLIKYQPASQSLRCACAGGQCSSCGQCQWQPLPAAARLACSGPSSCLHQSGHAWHRTYTIPVYGQPPRRPAGSYSLSRNHQLAFVCFSCGRLWACFWIGMARVHMAMATHARSTPVDPLGPPSSSVG